MAGTRAASARETSSSEMAGTLLSIAAGAGALVASVGLHRAAWFIDTAPFCAAGSCAPRPADVLPARSALADAGLGSLEATVTYGPWVVLILGVCAALVGVGLVQRRRSPAVIASSLLVLYYGIFAAVRWEVIEWMSWVND